MRSRFQPPPATLSPLGQLDPRWKLVGLAVLVISTALLHTVPAVALALVGALLLGWLARLPGRWYLGRLEALAWLLGLFVIPLPFLVRGNGPSWGWGPVQVSLEGILLGLVFTGKAVALVTFVLVLLATAPLEATLKAAHALRVPGLFVQLVLMSYRYLFLLAEELSRLRLAMRVRGFRNRASWHSYRTFGRVAGTLLVRGHERAERVADAMRCRGFDGQFRSLVEFRTTWADGLFLAGCVLLAAGLLVLDRLPGS